MKRYIELTFDGRAMKGVQIKPMDWEARGVILDCLTTPEDIDIAITMDPPHSPQCGLPFCEPCGWCKLDALSRKNP